MFGDLKIRKGQFEGSVDAPAPEQIPLLEPQQIVPLQCLLYIPALPGHLLPGALKEAAGQ